ncbi:MAG: serine hydrolase [Vicinamibacterales bacterium]
MNAVKVLVLLALGVSIAAMGLYVANADDAPGAAGLGFLLMVAAVLLAAKAARRRLPAWLWRTALAGGVVIAGFAAFLSHAVTVAAPLFPRPQDVPSVSEGTVRPHWAAAVDRARPMVRAAIVGQNLPGVSIAVGIDGGLVWAEGFGWRDVATQTPVTPATRFNIGTAASAVTAGAPGPLGLLDTGADAAAEWSPEAIGEPGEDFPPLTIIRHVILQPMGLAPAEYPLPHHRATFYVPRSDANDPRRGRRLMYMRDLACCAGAMAFYSTPSDLVRVALATKAGSVDGELAGGRVMSLTTGRDGRIAVAVASNTAYADTAALARSVAEVFAEQK